MTKLIDKLFSKYDVDIIEKFEIIFDRANSEKVAKDRAVDLYFTIKEETQDIDIDIQEIIESAESFGFDFEDFEELISQNE